MSPPSAFGTYRVLHQIGSGVLGPVFRGYDSQQDRLAAIKTIKLDLVPEAASRVADRLRALAAAKPAHPAIVGAMDAGLAGATPFIALEYASGESLDALLRQSGAWPVARALPVLREIAAAVDASWAASVGHGALHPRDVFVEAGSTDVRVTGFGIGQALEAAGVKAPLRRPYSAPERSDATPWDIRADIYSLGVVAFELVSGQRPVGPDDEGETIAAELPADARAAIRRVLAVAMADEPNDRYESAAGFVEALAGAAQPGWGIAPNEVDSVGAVPPAAPAEEVAGPAGESATTVEPPEEPEASVASAVTNAPNGELSAPKRGRITRARPIALDLPLLDESDAPGESASDTPAAEPTPVDVPHEASGPALPEPEPVAHEHDEAVSAPAASVEPAPEVDVELAREPEPASEPRFTDVHIEPDVPVRPSPSIDFGRSIIRNENDALDSDAPVAAFPWMAVIAVFTAGLVLGGVVMYQWGWRRGSVAGRQAAAAAASAVTAVVPVTGPPPAATPSPAARSTPAPRPSVSPEAAATGRLVIQSVPAGALVTIDGRRVGETPVSVPLPLGRHEVQVARPGYVPYNERIELTKRAASRTLRVQLKRGAGGTTPEDMTARAGVRGQGWGVKR